MRQDYWAQFSNEYTFSASTVLPGDSTTRFGSERIPQRGSETCHRAPILPWSYDQVSWPNNLIRRDSDQAGPRIASDETDLKRPVRETFIQSELSPFLDRQMTIELSDSWPAAVRSSPTAHLEDVSNGCALAARTACEFLMI